MMYTVAGSHGDTLCYYLYVIFLVHFKIRCADLTAKPPVKYFNFLSGIYLQSRILIGESRNVT